MTTIIPIDSDKIVELLFENEHFSNDINLLNMMKIYHELENNQDEIKKNIDKKFMKRIKLYIKKEKEPISCHCYNIKLILYLFFFISCLMSFAGFIAYSIITKK